MYDFSDEEKVLKLLSVFKDKRLEQLEAEFNGLDECLAFWDQMRALYNSLSGPNADELKARFRKYDDSAGSVLASAGSFFYEKGFTDCLRLIRMIFNGNG